MSEMIRMSDLLCWHTVSEWFLYFAIGFFAGNILPFYEILKNYRRLKELDRHLEENWPEWRRQIQKNFEEQERQVSQKSGEIK